VAAPPARPTDYLLVANPYANHRNRQRYSNYVPLGRASATTSRATSVTKDTPRSPKEQSARSVRAGSANHPSKRRSTMNSRDAAYDEEEQLRRAIQASKEQNSPEIGDPPSRRPKRGRSDSDESVFHARPKLPESDSLASRDASNLKRQRTSSPSLSPPTSKTMADDDTDDDGALRNGPKKNRSARTHREKSEREDRERSRAENASKRKGRADRRRAEGLSRLHPQIRHTKTDICSRLGSFRGDPACHDESCCQANYRGAAASRAHTFFCPDARSDTNCSGPSWKHA
jgi:hypothetical protein